MKKIVVFSLIFLPSILSATESQFNYDFQRRFGSDSAVYNEPHFFATRNKASRDKRPRKKSFREQLRTRMNTIQKKKKRCLHGRTHRSLKQDPDLSDR